MQASSLNRQVSFQQVLPLLGITVKSNALPALANCPLCHAVDQLVIAPDIALGGEWTYCRGCEFAGDIITLASKTWKLGIDLTLRKLAMHPDISAAIGSDKAIETYIAKYHTLLIRIGEFWKNCQTTHIHGETPGLRMLQQRFAANEVDENWLTRAGRFLGSTVKETVDATFDKNKFDNWSGIKTQRSGSFPSKFFSGTCWKEVLVIPFWDMPGRICGFLYIGRAVNIDTDFVYKGLLHDVRDAGLAMLPAVMEGSHKHFGHFKFIFTEPDIAIRMHVRHSKDHPRPLPLAATWDNGTYVTNEVWNWFKPKQLIFWGINRIKTIAQARKANGCVSLLNVPRTELETNMRNYSPVEWLLRMKAVAIPWVTALQDYLADLDDTSLEEALLTVGFNSQELDDFVAGCDHALQERLQFVAVNKSLARTVPFENHRVTQKADGWYLAKNDAQISNAVIHIKYVLTTHDKRSYYRGHITFDGQDYPFTEKVSTLEKGVLSWAQAYLRDHARAGVSEFYPSWNKKALQLAIKFSKPEHTEGVDIIGWDQFNRQFNFPQFAIRMGGVLNTNFPCLFDNSTAPARDLPVPDMFPRKHIEALNERHDETQIFWATAACIAANIVAPAVNRNQLPILLSGDGAKGVGCSAALRLGCSEIVHAHYKGMRYPQPRIPALPASCGWPSLVREALDSEKLGWLDQEQAKQCLFTLSDVAGRVLALRGRANLILHNRQLGSLQLLHHAAPYVLPHYFKDLARRNVLLPDEQTDLALDVVSDMADWFERLGGNRKVVEAAYQILHTPRSKAASDYFCELVFRLFEDGVLSFGSTSMNTVEPDTSIISVAGDENMIWISQDRFSDAVKHAGGIAPDLLLISRSLATSGILVDEPSYKHGQGWLVRESWWNLKLQTWRETE